MQYFSKHVLKNEKSDYYHRNNGDFFEMLQFLPVNFLLVKKTTNISIFAQLLIVLLKYAFL